MSDQNKKTVAVLENGGGRMGNQLWNDMSIYAYSLERGYEFKDWATFEFARYFEFPKVRNFFIRTIFFNPLVINAGNRFFRKRVVRVFLKKIVLYGLSRLFKKVVPQKVVSVSNEGPFYLPPSEPASERQAKIISEAEVSDGKSIYFTDSMFKNPEGLQKHREKVIHYFRPRQSISESVKSFISAVRKDFTHIVGVHYRQGDYKQPAAREELYFSEKEILSYLKGYLEHFNKTSEETCFVVCSDESFNQDVFKGLNVRLGPGGEAEDLFTLASTDAIIASPSSYSAFSSYYGDIPLILFQRGGIDWEYYEDKAKYFENKYFARA